MNHFFFNLSKPKWLILLLVLIIFAFYAKVLSFEFLVFDDDKYITKNEVISSSDKSVADCLAYKFKAPDYFPLSFLAWRTARVVFGFNPVVFHAMNFLFHLLNVLIIFVLCLKILKRTSIPELHRNILAFFVSFLFAIHPLHVESVAWIIDFKDLLYTLFYLLSIYFYIAYIERKQAVSLAISSLFFLLSILSKSTAISLVAMLFLVDWFYVERFTVKRLIEKIPYFIIALFGLYIFGMLTNFSANLANGSTINSITNKPIYPESMVHLPAIYQQLIIVSYRVFFWLFHALIPIKLTVLYPRETMLEAVSLILPFLPVVLIGLMLIIVKYRKQLKTEILCLLIFIITISPALIHPDYGIAVFTPDRYMYLPLLGIIVLLVYLFYRLLPKYKVVAIVVGSVLLLLWMFQTATYLPVWKNTETLFNRAIEIDKVCDIAYSNRSIYYMNKGDVEKEFADLNEFLKLSPESYTHLVRRGVILFDKKKIAESKADFDLAYKVAPDKLEVLTSRGIFFLKTKEYKEAYANFNKAYEIDSNNIILNKNIAKLYDEVGDPKSAEVFWTKCINIEPDNDEYLFNLSFALFKTGELNRSTIILNKLLEKDPKQGRALELRSFVNYKKGNKKLAYDDVLKAQLLNEKIDTAYIEKLKKELGE